MADPVSSPERIEVRRTVHAPASAVFALLRDPQGHVAIDASGMLQDADGDPVSGVGDSFVVHMDREALGDRPDLTTYDVTVTIRTYEPDREISWSVLGPSRPPVGQVYGYRLTPVDVRTTEVVSFYDWSGAHPEWKARGIFPVIPPAALKGTLGILDRTVRRGYVRP